MYTVRVKDVPAQPVASIRATVPNSELVAFFEEACREMYSYLAQIGVAATAEPMSLWHSEPGHIPDASDIETCIPVEREFPAEGRIQSSELPAGTLASTMHEGSYDDMGAAFDAVWVWMQEQGYDSPGSPRDVVWVGPSSTTDPADYRTEIVYPVQKSS